MLSQTQRLFIFSYNLHVNLKRSTKSVFRRKHLQKHPHLWPLQGQPCYNVSISILEISEGGGEGASAGGEVGGEPWRAQKLAFVDYQVDLNVLPALLTGFIPSKIFLKFQNRYRYCIFHLTFIFDESFEVLMKVLLKQLKVMEMGLEQLRLFVLRGVLIRGVEVEGWRSGEQQTRDLKGVLSSIYILNNLLLHK